MEKHSDKYSYEDDIRITSEFLDTIDFEPLFRNQTEVTWELMNLIEDTYAAKADEWNHDFFQGYVFNAMDTYEFCEYLSKRYGWRIEEVCEPHYLIYH